MHTCYFCNATVPSTETAIEAGWYPSFWFSEEEESGEPCCEACAIEHLDFSDGEPMLKAEGSQLDCLDEGDKTMEKELVYLSTEEFPRLRDGGGRLIWLGRHGSRPNYHDPEAAAECFALGPEPDDGTEWTTDPSRWAPPVPSGVYIVGVMPIT